MRTRTSTAVVAAAFVLCGCSDPAPAASAVDAAGQDGTTVADSSTVGDSSTDTASSISDSSTDTASTDAGGTSSDSAFEIGCKCGDPGCCPGVAVIDCCPGATCPLQHETGWGATYLDCRPLGKPGDPTSYNKEMASEASRAWRAAGTPAEMTCGTSAGICNMGYSGSTGLSTLWLYSGPFAGKTTNLISPGSCLCPEGDAASNPDWN